MTDSQIEVQPEAALEGTAAETNKLTDTKEIIAYLAEKFPLCFSVEGEAKPLKVGLFQDLAEALKDDEKVSKTQLRHVLRQYTSNWRYLYGCREGAQRVDLQGNNAGIIDAEQAAFAAAQLAEAKARFAEQRKAKAAEKRAQQRRKPNNKAPRTQGHKGQRVQPKLNPLDLSQATVGTRVKVKAGGAAKSATILEVQKEAARVEFANGVVMTVTADRLFS